MSLGDIETRDQIQREPAEVKVREHEAMRQHLSTLLALKAWRQGSPLRIAIEPPHGATWDKSQALIRRKDISRADGPLC